MILCYVLCGVAVAVILAHSLLECNYFFRMCLTVLLAKFTKRKSHIMEMTEVEGNCFLTDIDTLLTHMNNARYLREIDFARVDFYQRTGLYRTIVSNGGGIVQGAATIRYRRFIKTFARFKITSKIVYWDEQSIFMEHQFLGKSDGFCHAIVVCRQRLINCNAEDIMNILLNNSTTTSTSELQSSQNNLQKMENGEISKVKPEMPEEIAKWLESNEISSSKLRKNC